MMISLRVEDSFVASVVVALVVTKPIQEYLLSTQVGGRVRLKATVVMTSISLMEQWEDDVSKVSSACDNSSNI